MADPKPTAQDVEWALRKSTPRCDAMNVNYGERCEHKATYRMIGGIQAGQHFCTRHANKRSRYAQRITTAKETQ